MTFAISVSDVRPGKVIFVPGTTACGDFQKRNTLLSRAAGDREEVAAIGLCEASVSLGQIGSDREGGAIQLVDEESVAAWETFG